MQKHTIAGYKAITYTLVYTYVYQFYSYPGVKNLCAIFPFLYKCGVYNTHYVSEAGKQKKNMV